MKNGKRNMVCFSLSLKLSVLFLLFYSINAKADYLTYHKKIIKAEEEFLDYNIKGALKIYKTIFDEYKPFAKDAYIALQLACKIKDSTYTTYFIKKCFENGISWNMLTKSYHIRNYLFQSYPNISVIQEKYTLIRKHYVESLDIKLRNYLSQLSKNDAILSNATSKLNQAYLKSDSVQKDSSRLKFIQNELDTFINRKSDIKWLAWYERWLKTNYMPHTKYDTAYIALLEENILSIEKISKKLGYVPAEKTIGVMDWELDDKDSSMRMTLLSIIIHQFYHHGCGFWLLEKELMASVRRGEIHPRVYAILYEWSFLDLKPNFRDFTRTNLSFLYKVKCQLPEKQLFYNICPLLSFERTKDVVSVYMNRAQLSISSVEHDKRKRKFAKQNNMQLFFGIFDDEQ